jgi:DNA-binding LacI/PurR family transcriptional regulator
MNIPQPTTDQYEAIAQAAITLFKPPYRRMAVIFLDPDREQEAQDWHTLRDALHDAGYGWEEYT